MKPMLDDMYNQCGENFFFRLVNNTINFYALTPQVTYQDLLILTCHENRTRSLLQQLYAQDEQSINHLLVDLVVILQGDNNDTYASSFKLCISKQEGLFAIVPLHTPACRVDFVSRSHENGYRHVLDEEVFAYVAEGNEIASYAHSEALFIGLLGRLPEILENFLKHLPLAKVLAINFIYYSSLDTCDWCQVLLHTMHQSLQSDIQKHGGRENVPVRSVFYSLAPCKKSSYYMYELSSEPYRLYFSKPHQQFFRENQTPVASIQQWSPPSLDLHNAPYQSLSICNMCSLGI
jgi:hypothetical protein